MIGTFITFVVSILKKDEYKLLIVIKSVSFPIFLKFYRVLREDILSNFASLLDFKIICAMLKS